MITVPGVGAVHHVAYTVPDLDQAVTFFIDALGAQLAYLTGPVEDPAGLWMLRQLGVHRDAVAHIAMLRLGPVTNVELFQYTSPDQRRVYPRNSDWGGHHLALATTDLDASLDHLTAYDGVVALGDPQTVTDGPIAGVRFIYLRTPFGLHLELSEIPDQLPFHDSTSVRLYDPPRAAS
ncbi:VOC family protein [Streptomyces acidiscabies]|uniref:Glyoxalase n=1 Tax=Streptomyces acidiscabies TaxID=42234 RepID=A0A0L0JIW7_9ACTN|nr:VOC family protein [Streptomyces acidiscabies]KND25621.1 glyoxalase [Streptomyces acidiscabies]